VIYCQQKNKLVKSMFQSGSGQPVPACRLRPP